MASVLASDPSISQFKIRRQRHLGSTSLCLIVLASRRTRLSRRRSSGHRPIFEFEAHCERHLGLYAHLGSIALFCIALADSIGLSCCRPALCSCDVEDN